MADDSDDVEDMLEAPFRKGAGDKGNGECSPLSGSEGKRKRSKHRHHRRSRHSHSGSPGRKHKRSNRSESRERHGRSGSREKRRRSGSREKRQGSGSREKRQGSGSKERRRRSGSREKRRRSGSRERRPGSGSRERRRRSGSREKRRRSGSREKRRRSGSRERRRRSGSREKRQQSRSPLRRPSFKGGDDFLGLYRRVGGRSPDPEPPSEDKDRRTVMCMQLAAYVGPKELEEFFQKVGQVKEVKMIADKNSRRSKGIAYIEFHDENSVTPALQLSGQKLFGVPIRVQVTMAEKNRLAAQAQNLMKKEGPRNLYVGSLHYNITEPMLRKIFEPFGYVEKLNIQRDENSLSKGYGFIEFRDADAAERAKCNLDGFELAGRPIKINPVTDRGGDPTGGAMELLDSDNYTAGVGMTQQGRVSLMAKLAEGHNAGLVVPTIPALAQLQQPPAPVPSACFMLTNMFDPSKENQADWEVDIKDDVLEECMEFGNVLHIYVDRHSLGHVYIKCSNSQVAMAAIRSLDGRFFAGTKVVAQTVPEATYHMKFPESKAAVMPLKSSS